MFKRWVVLLTLRAARVWSIGILAALSIVACGDGGPQQVKVAVSVPLGLEIGHDMLHAAQLALDEAGGQVGDVKVALLVFDTSDPDGSPISPEWEQDVATLASGDKAIVAYLGPPTSDQARASMAVLNEASIVQLSQAATWPGLTKPGFGPGEPGKYYPTGRRHFFRLVPSDEVQGEVAARWADWLHFRSVYVIDDGTAYGRGVAGIFELGARDLGIEVLVVDSFDGGSASPEALEGIAMRVADEQPELLFLGSSLGAGGEGLIAALRGLDPDVQIMVPDGMVQDQLITDLGAELVEGIYGTNVAVPAERLESASRFRERYQAAYAKEPPPYAVTTYEAMQVLLHAIERAERPTREGVLAAVSDMEEFYGVLGRWQFDARGDISLTTISGMQIQDGAWTFFRILE